MIIKFASIFINFRFLSDPEWSVHRKLLNPAFGHKVLLSFISTFNAEVDKLLQTIDQLANNNKAVDLMAVLQEFTLDIATSKLCSFINKLHEYNVCLSFQLETTMGKSVSQESNDTHEDLLINYQW